MSSTRLTSLTLCERTLREAQPVPLETFKILPSYVGGPRQGRTASIMISEKGEYGFVK